MKIYEILNLLKQLNEEYIFEGNECDDINGFCSLFNYKENCITWIRDANIIPNDFDIKKIKLAVVQHGENVDINNKIISKESKRIFFMILEHFFSDKKHTKPSIGEGTYIGKNVKLGKNIIIGHNCSLDGDITIGDNTVIHNNVSIINSVKIGANCDIQSGVVIGHDGFGFTEDLNHEKSMIKHYGGVSIGDNVYFGGNCYVSRGTIDDTLIGNGVKIDSLCAIGHNSIIEDNVAIIAGTILYGSVLLKKNAYIATGIIKNQTVMEENSFAGIGSVVLNDVKKDEVVVGIPARPIRRKE